MHHLPGKRVLALLVGLATAGAASAYAQDTTGTGRATIDTTAPEAGAIDTSGVDTSATRDTTDTSGVQNAPGYRGMERDTTMFPDSGGPPADAGAVEDQATEAERNPAEFGGTGRLEGDSAEAGDTTGVGDTELIRENPAGGDTTGQVPDSTQ